MGFDGIIRPAQVNPNTDSLNPNTASNLARADEAGKPLVQKLTRDEQIKALQRENQQYRDAEDEEGQGETFSEEEAEQILLFAKMRGLMNVSLESGRRYGFHVNPLTGMVDMTDLETGELVLQLTPTELMRLSDKIQRYAGMLTDRSG